MSTFGGADPPTRSCFRLSGGSSVTSGRTPFQIVGTPVAWVTRSSRINRTRPSGDMSDPGKTSSAPVKGAA